MKRLIAFCRLSSFRKRLFFQAVAGLIFYRIAIRHRRLKSLLAALDSSLGESSENAPDADMEIANQVAWAVASAANHLPLQFVCLTRALAGMRLLHKHNIGSTLYLGASGPPDDFKAHAWLRCGRSILTGEKESRRYQTLAAFHSRPDRGNTEPDSQQYSEPAPLVQNSRTPDT